MHVHILPRKSGNFARNDDVYNELNAWNTLDNDDRKPRSLEEMSAEADMLRQHFPDNQ